MGSSGKFGNPGLDQVKVLGRRFETTRKMLSDFRILTNKSYLTKLLDDLNDIRDELIRINGATEIDDGTLVIKTEVLIPFLKPATSSPTVFANQPPDLTNPKFINRVALDCSLNQWLFLAKRIPSKRDQDHFIELCVSELRKSTETND